MFASYDRENGWTTIFNEFNKVPEIKQDILDLIDLLSSEDISGLSNNDLIDFVDGIQGADDAFKEFLSTVDTSGDIMAQYQSYLAKSSSLFGTFGTAIKGAATNMAIMLAVTLAIKAAVKIWDTINVTVEETQQKYEELNNTLSTLTSEYDDLNSRNPASLSNSEKERLEYLKERIELEKELLELQQHEIYRAKVGGNFTDYFDKDSYTHKLFFSNDEYKVSDSENATANKADEINQLMSTYDKLIAKEQEYANIPINDNNAASLEKQRTDLAIQIENTKGQLDAAYEQSLIDLDALQSDYDYLQTIIDSDVDSATKNKAKEEQAVFKERIDNVKWFIEQLKAVIYDTPSIAETLAERTNISADTFKNKFTADELLILLNAEFDEDATIADLKDLIKKSQEAADDEPIDFKTRLSNIGEIADELDDLSAIFEDVKNGGSFDFGSLVDENFVNNFGKYEEQYRNFVDTITNSPSDINACQKAFDDLAAAWLNGSGMLDNLTEETADYTIKLLEEKGVVNAAEIIHGKLTWAKAEEIVQTMDLTGNIEAEISAILSENQGLGLNEQMLKAVALAKLTANGTSLNFSSDLEAIKSLTQGLGGAITMLSMYTQARDLQGNPSAHWSGMSDVAAMAKAEVQSAINNAFNFTVPTPKFTGGTSKSSSGGSSSKIDPYKAEIDALQDYVDAYEEAQRKREQIDKQYDNEEDTAKKIKLVEERIAAMQEEQKAIEALNDARDAEIQKNVETLRSRGFNVTYDPTNDKLQIQNIEHLNELKGKDQEATNDLIKETEELIDTTRDMTDENKDLADTWQDNVYSIQDLRNEVEDLRRELYQATQKKYEFDISIAEELNDFSKMQSLIKKQMQDIVAEINKAYEQGLTSMDDYVQELIDDLMSAANKLKDAMSDMWEDRKSDYDAAHSAVINVIDQNIEALEKEKEALEKLNDEEERSQELAKLREALDKAEKNKVIQVYRKGQG